MVPPELPTKSKTTPFIGGVLVAFFILSLWSYTAPPPQPPVPTQTRARTRPDPTIFYDDPTISYTINTPVRNWDEKRFQWRARNPKFSQPDPDRVVMVTGSQSDPCPNPAGDSLLLRSFKNKVDYCRLHGYDVFYNIVLLDPKMPGYWAKYPVIRSAMMAHPEAEWVWWVDSDAIITDMDFSIPFEKYKAHNLVVHGWADLVYEKKSWTGLNAGVMLIRNCQWSMDLLDRWASFSPISPNYDKWGPILKSIFTDKLYPESDDQTALGYLLVTGSKKWREQVYLENEYFLEGYWVELVGKLGAVSDSYKAVEKTVRRLRMKHAERGGEDYRVQWEAYFKENGFELRRPFITHFTGCKPCNGERNVMYPGKECWDGMIKALNFADNQVLRNFGYFRPDLYNTSLVQPISSD